PRRLRGLAYHRHRRRRGTERLRFLSSRPRWNRPSRHRRSPKSTFRRRMTQPPRRARTRAELTSPLLCLAPPVRSIVNKKIQLYLKPASTAPKVQLNLRSQDRRVLADASAERTPPRP